MENFLKIKKRKIIILLLLFFNQFLLSGYALNHKKTDLVRSEKNNLHGNFYTTFNYLIHLLKIILVKIFLYRRDPSK